MTVTRQRFRMNFHGSPWVVLTTGGFLVIFGAKLALIGAYADPAPFLDEWNGDASNFLVPLLHGTLTWRDWVAAHNEHRIFLTRLVVWLVLEITGSWDRTAQMEVNAALHAASLVAIALMLSDAASRGRDTVTALTVIAFTIIATVVPFGFGNTLQAFQTQFYLFIALSFACIALLVPAAAFTARWWAGLALGVVSLFSIASGALALVPPLGVALLQLVLGQRRGMRELAGAAGLALVTVVMLTAVPTVPRHVIYKAHSLGQFLVALAYTAAWPVGGSLFVVTQGPSVVASLLVIARSTVRTDPNWRLVAGLGWIMIQVAVLSWSRALMPGESRYMDLFIVGQLVGAASAMALLKLRFPRWLPRPLLKAGVIGWFFAILASYLQTALSFLPRNLRAQSPEGRATVRHLREYLGHPPDPSAPDEDWMSDFFPDSHLVRSVLDDPRIREVIPASLGGGAPDTWLTWLENHLVAIAPLLISVGVIMLAAAAVIVWRARRRPVPLPQPGPAWP